MSRIEIPLAEYKSLKNRINNLESSLTDVSKEASVYKEKLDTIKGLINDLGNEKLFARIFLYKSILKPLKSIFHGL